MAHLHVRAGTEPHQAFGRLLEPHPHREACATRTQFTDGCT
jgi:hypothetical protein